MDIYHKHNDLEKYSYGLICLVGEINGLAWL